MPAAYINKLIKEKETGKSKARLEHLWKKAKDIASKAGETKNYAYIMGIFKKMIGKGNYNEDTKFSNLIDRE